MVDQPNETEEGEAAEATPSHHVTADAVGSGGTITVATPKEGTQSPTVTPSH